ncbi:unnamed protein product [Prorocentrum cordatum]|uniref:Uncharacterized protein n=1 Tax=Prorocentrum cordatum TaxID=2364126 RepID=A0ABN9UA43_9DINO|nr:unnamed protein product [Polarella glacialis]
MPPDAGDLGHVVGVWSDENRSVYVVELDPGGASCSVQTTRKSGEQRFTKALIAAHGRVSWGQSYVLDGDRTASTGRPRWLHLKGGKKLRVVAVRRRRGALPQSGLPARSSPAAAGRGGGTTPGLHRPDRRSSPACGRPPVYSEVRPVPLQEECSKLVANCRGRSVDDS